MNLKSTFSGKFSRSRLTTADNVRRTNVIIHGAAVCTSLLTMGLAVTETTDAVASSLADDGWGTVKGRFVYDGVPPKPQKISVTKDIDVCTKQHPVNESLLVDETGGLANVVVYIRKKRGKKLDVHPDYAESAKDSVVINNRHCRFQPHIALVRTNQDLVIKNSDPTGHNTKADFGKNQRQSFNTLIPAGGEYKTQIARDEGRPTPIGCNIHPWMTGYLLVREDPYMVVSEKDGTFEIRHIPVGQHEFQFWHEKPGYLKNLKFKVGKTNKRGRSKIKVDKGVTDLGDIEVSHKVFEGK